MAYTGSWRTQRFPVGFLMIIEIFMHRQALLATKCNILTM